MADRLTELSMLTRGTVYHFEFSENEIRDGLLLDCDVNINSEQPMLSFYPLEDGNILCNENELIEYPVARFVCAERIDFENAAALMTEMDALIEKAKDAFYKNGTSLKDEEDLINALEINNDDAVAGYFLDLMEAKEASEAHKAIGCIFNNIPYLLKRTSNSMPYIVLLAAIKRLNAMEGNMNTVPFPILPDQASLCSAQNVTMARKTGYQIRFIIEDLIKKNGYCYAHRYIGYVYGIQRSRARGFILFAGNINIEFSFSGILDKRLLDLFEISLREVGGIEIEFSIGYVPKEGGATITPCGKDLVLTEKGLQICREAYASLNISDDFVVSEEYRPIPICPSSRIHDDFLINMARVIHEGDSTTAHLNEFKNRLFYPSGTKHGQIIRFASRISSAGQYIGEGDIACKGNVIHFNILQVIDKELYDMLIENASGCIGKEVAFELAFNSMKGSLAIWADAIRMEEKHYHLPPEYDPDVAWSAARSQMHWKGDDTVSQEYRSLQPWLPIMNMLLDKCAYGYIDTSSFSEFSSNAPGGTYLSFEGKINFETNNAAWCNFKFTSIADRYLLSTLISSLRYNTYDQGGSKIWVIFATQPTQTPGRYTADWIIPTSHGRGELKKLTNGHVLCPLNRSGNPILDIADGFVPSNIWGKPRNIQQTLLRETGLPDLFADTKYPGIITQFFSLNSRGIISAGNSRIPFAIEQVADSKLRASIKNSRYANIPVMFIKRQGPLSNDRTPLIADYIVSSNSDGFLPPNYRSVTESLSVSLNGNASVAINTSPQNNAETGETTSSASLDGNAPAVISTPPLNNVRTGVIKAINRSGSDSTYVLVDTRPTVWFMQNRKNYLVCSHYTFNIARVSDQRLANWLSTETSDSLNIRVTFSLVRLNENEFPAADNIQFPEREGAQFVKRDEYVPAGAPVPASAIREAQRYRGIVTWNTAPINIFIRLNDNEAFRVPGRPDQTDFHTCTNNANMGRYYIMDEKLQKELSEGKRGMRVLFIPTAPYRIDRDPEASYVISAEWDNDYVPVMPPKEYISNGELVAVVSSAGTTASAETPEEQSHDESAESSEVSLLQQRVDLQKLQYHTEPNEFDKLFQGKHTEFGMHFFDAQSATPPRRIYNLCRTSGMTGDRYVGIKDASKCIRLAFADAFVRNYQIVFGPDGLSTMLNCLVDLYLEGTTKLLGAYDEKAYAILHEVRDILANCANASTQIIVNVSSKLRAMQELKAQQKIAPPEPKFEVSMLQITSFPHASISMPDSPVAPVPVVRSENAVDETLSRFIQEVPYLAAKVATAANGDQDFGALSRLNSSNQFTSEGVHNLVCDLMNAILKVAERRYINQINPEARAMEKRNISKSLSVAYLYMIALKLYFEAPRIITGFTWSEEENKKYLQFIKKALSFAYLGKNDYERVQKECSAGRYRVRDLWQYADQDVRFDNLCIIPDPVDSRNTFAEGRYMGYYITYLLQTAWLCQESIMNILDDAEREKLTDSQSAWGEAFNQLCKSFQVDNLEALSEAYNREIDTLCASIRDVISVVKNSDFTGLGDKTNSNSPLGILKKNMPDRLSINTELLTQLDLARKAAESNRKSDRLDGLSEVKSSLEGSYRNYLDNPRFSAHIQMELMKRSKESIEKKLEEDTQNDVAPTFKAGTCNITNDNQELIIPIKIKLSIDSLSRSNVAMSIASVPPCIEALAAPPASFNMSSGEERTYEFRFRINEDIEAFLRRQTIEITLNYSASLRKYSSRERRVYTDTERGAGILLTCAISTEKIEIIPGTFNPQSANYAEAVKYSDAVRNQFVGRERELQKMKDAIYKSDAEEFIGGVGITIIGRRRTGKSWLAGRFCEEIAKLGSEKIIVSEKIDISHIERGMLVPTIIAAIINGSGIDKKLAQEVYDGFKPSVALLPIANSMIEIGYEDLGNGLLEFLEKKLDLELKYQISFSSFYNELSRKYEEKYASKLPPILITMDEFTSVQGKMIDETITRNEILSILKLTETYNINVLLICADNFQSVKVVIDENAFTHYKTNIHVDGITESETRQMLCRPIPVRMPGNDTPVKKQCISEEVADQLHKWYDGNVYLIAIAAEKIIERMNKRGYAFFEKYHLDNYQNGLLKTTTNKEYLEAYTDDGRFLNDGYPAIVLRWLNIQAMVQVAEEGGTCPYGKVLDRVRKEYATLFEAENRNRLVNVLRYKYEINPDELNSIAEHIMKRLGAADNVISWLVERGVLTKTDNDTILHLPLKAYVEARKIQDAPCREIEKLEDYAADTSDIVRNVIDPDATVEDPDY